MDLPISVLSQVTNTLDKLKIRYLLVGSFASSVHEWNDVLGILAVAQDGLDIEYLRNWAERLGVNDLLQRGLNEVESQG